MAPPGGRDLAGGLRANGGVCSARRCSRSGVAMGIAGDGGGSGRESACRTGRPAYPWKLRLAAGRSALGKAVPSGRKWSDPDSSVSAQARRRRGGLEELEPGLGVRHRGSVRMKLLRAGLQGTLACNTEERDAVRFERTSRVARRWIRRRGSGRGNAVKHIMLSERLPAARSHRDPRVKVVGLAAAHRLTAPPRSKILHVPMEARSALPGEHGDSRLSISVGSDLERRIPRPEPRPGGHEFDSQSWVRRWRKNSSACPPPRWI